MKAIGLCLNRFDEDTKASFLDLYTKVDAGINLDVVDVIPIEETGTSDEVPF
jgi:hypothetical protein